jgi:hypothetical protein
MKHHRLRGAALRQGDQRPPAGRIRRCVDTECNACELPTVYRAGAGDIFGPAPADQVGGCAVHVARAQGGDIGTGQTLKEDGTTVQPFAIAVQQFGEWSHGHGGVCAGPVD